MTFRNHYSCTAAILCIVATLHLQVSAAVTLDNLAECRSASTDSFSFKECVGLQHQASETLLTSIENSWREYLEIRQVKADITPLLTVTESAAEGPTEQVQTGVKLSENESDGATSATADSEIEEPEGRSGNVVAIVGDDTVSAPDSGSVISISSQALLESDFPALSADNIADLSPVAQRQRFEVLADFYRQYRDERCTWEGGLYGADRADVYITACKAWLNQERAKAISLQLSEKRASDANGIFFSGFYIEDDDGGIFQSCDRRQEWRLAGDFEVLSDIGARYQAIARDNLEMAYLEMRGNYTADARNAGFSGKLQVRSFNLLRAIDEADCSSVKIAQRTIEPVSDGTSSAVDSGSQVSSQTSPGSEPADITVDTLGASGFLYGYFVNWVSACAVEHTSVCLAQVESGYTGLGDWRLVVDRSLDRRWRVQLIPIVSDATISRTISIEIDGKIVSSYPLSGNGTTVKAEVGVVLAQGDAALQLVNRMRNGQSLSISWSLPSEIGSELTFSLVGVTKALEFFDQSG